VTYFSLWFWYRYKKLLSGVDLTKDFFFSYTYRIMQSLQRNVQSQDDEQMPYGNMFVWNAFLTGGIRNRLKNTRWTVALVHGFFEQVPYLTLSCADGYFLLEHFQNFLRFIPLCDHLCRKNCLFLGVFSVLLSLEEGLGILLVQGQCYHEVMSRTPSAFHC
jgi:hypothetical protein